VSAGATPAPYADGVLPANVSLGEHTVLTGAGAFRRFMSTRDRALVIGAHATMDGVQFALGADAQATIGDYCYFTNAVLLCELELTIGSYVVIGWNTTITDTDFHPIAPAERVLDAVACSPIGKDQPRPPIARRPVVIEDDVWIGPNAAIMKGVRVGTGSFIEPGAIVTADVPPYSRVAGNPARVIGQTR
jgi:acetyltransferase-like isoleucine patch superfamily enzyme